MTSEKNLQIYCVTDKPLQYLNELNYNLVGVGKSYFPNNYIKCNSGDNIYYKEEFYSELTFHYWFWKNQLKNIDKNIWIGFCQKRRFWLQNKKNDYSKDIKKQLLNKIPDEWTNFDSVICEPISLKNTKLIKIFKRGWKNLLKNPLLIFDRSKHTIKLHFDMFHGYGNIDLAISVMHNKDKNEFKDFIYKSSNFNPHIMFVSKPDIINEWFIDLFSWLVNCEKIFGFEKLKGYDTKRLYAYLSERYLSFWFKKYTKSIEWPYVFVETDKI